MIDKEEGKAIRRENERIKREHADKMREAMETYNRDVFHPARKLLIERCEKNGHVRGPWHSNGLGWSWYWCANCGASFDKEGPEE